MLTEYIIFLDAILIIGAVIPNNSLDWSDEDSEYKEKVKDCLVSNEDNGLFHINKLLTALTNLI
jgi:hypothetical protein